MFSKDDAYNVKHWIEWWDTHKRNIFWTFHSFDTPQSNQPKAFHGGWKNEDKMGVSLLECCYFHIRESILLVISFSTLEKGGRKSGSRLLEVTRTEQNESRQIEQAEQLGKDLLDFSVQPSSSNYRKRNSIHIDEDSNPPKRQKMFKKNVPRKITNCKSFTEYNES